MLTLRQTYDQLIAEVASNTPFGEVTAEARAIALRRAARAHHVTEAEAAEEIPLGSRAPITRGIE